MKSTVVSAVRGGIRDWPMYAAVTGSALAAATSASASIISYNGPPVNATAAPGSGVALNNVTVPGMPTFFLGALAQNTNSGEVSAGNVLFQANQLFLVGHGPLDLGSNVTIGASRQFDPPQLPGTLFNRQSGSYSTGGWKGQSGQKGFEGFRFTTANNQVDYGYAELSWSAISGGPAPSSVTLYALAYDDTGASIVTPSLTSESSGSTPEPGTAGLMLLALGAAGVAVIRKHRNLEA